jgi:transposase InsO family protein
MTALPELASRVGLARACDGLGLSRATIARKDRRGGLGGNRRPPPLKLSDGERQDVLVELTSERFVDRAPHQVYATLLDEGRYLCSIRTMYRVLAAEKAVRERRSQRSHPVYAKPQLLAKAPRQLWSWDITKLKTDVRWTYLYLYVILDVFSRYVVGWMLSTRESGALARDLVEQCVLREGVPRSQLTLHADRGAPMRSRTLAEKLVDLGIEPSFSRPRQSNDNPFSESCFKTLKYAPAFPERFGDITHARAVLTEFFDHYNHAHRHTGIGLMTPAAVHGGKATALTAARDQVLASAFQRTPQRFKGRRPQPPQVPTKVYINPPTQPEDAPATIEPSATH